MESQPQNPEFKINPENFHPWKLQTCLIMALSLPKRFSLVNGQVSLAWSIVLCKQELYTRPLSVKKYINMDKLVIMGYELQYIVDGSLVKW